MDSSSWLHGYATTNTGGNNGFMCGYAAASSCTPAELQYREEEQQQFLISSQIQHHLNQISTRMNMDDDEDGSVYAPFNDGGVSPIGVHDSIVDGLFDPRHAASFPSSSSSSSSISLPSASLSCSPESSAHILAAPAKTASQYLEVSSQVPLPPPTAVPHDRQYTNLHVPAPAATAAHHDAAATAPANTGAFKRYERHLGVRRPPKAGAPGQRMFKTAMSVLSKMHAAASYRQQQYYYQKQAAAEASPPPSVNHLQHMFSERKRREKINDSFHALKTVLPPGGKKDKTSILIRAREYVRSLESKVSALEEKNRALESRLVRAGDSGDDQKVQVEITRAAKGERDLFTLKIVVRSPCNTTDVVLRTMQCLKERMGDGVSLVAMSTSDGTITGTSGVNTSPRDVLTMQIKSPPGAGWEEQPVKDAVAKVVADALSSSAAAAPQ